MSFSLEPRSFLLGFTIGILFLVLLRQIRPAILELREGYSVKREKTRAHHSSRIEETHRRLILQKAQGMHLAAPLFALDEILQPPMVLIPPVRTEPGGTPLIDDSVTATLPYLPAWPEVATIYQAPCLPVARVAASSPHIILTGAEGAGKSVALAHLASLAACRDSELGELTDCIPFLIHAGDLSLPNFESEHVLDTFIAASSTEALSNDHKRISSFVRQSFKNGRALLLIDGYDELTDEGQEFVVEYLRQLLKTYPQTRVITTALPDKVGGLFSLRFLPFTLIGWDSIRKKAFIQKWAEQWQRFVSTEAWAQSGLEMIDPIILDTWSNHGSQVITPLELTLMVWGAFAGDSQGPRITDAIASHIRRLTHPDIPNAAFESLANQVIINMQPIFNPREVEKWAFDNELTGLPSTQSELPGEDDPTKPSRVEETGSESELKSTPEEILSKFYGSGLFLFQINDRIRFIHPIFCGFLASRAISKMMVDERLLSQPNWWGKSLVLHYLIAREDIETIVDGLLKVEDPILERPLLTAARWLRDAPHEAPWRGKVLSGLARIFQDEDKPRGLRGQAMAALALSHDPSACMLFRQSLQSMSFELIRLAALGTGIMRDKRATELLAAALSAPSLSAKRAICIALIAIGTHAALDVVGRALLGGDEDMRLAAAEALANDPKEGYAMLKEGIKVKDYMVRRAVVHGLHRIDETWTIETLKSIQVEDNQWIVRTAATEVLERKPVHAEPKLPPSIIDPSETPWLIAFAGKYGEGIPPGAPTTDLLIRALKEGTIEERLAAMNLLRHNSSEGVIRSMYEIVFSDDSELREAAYQTIWEMASGGFPLPNPAQYGFA